MASPTGLCDHFPHMQRCKWVAMTSQCGLSCHLRLLRATASSDKSQDKGTCWFSGKGNTSEEDALSHKEHCCTFSGLGAPGDTYVFLTYHPSLHSPAENSWDGNVPLALKEHRENDTSLLSSAGFWRLLAANTVPACVVALGVVCIVCMEQMAPASSNEKQEEEDVAPWRETSICLLL